MAYTLKDQNGNFFNINGCRKGTLNYAYKYQGGFYQNNASSSTQGAFYSTYRRVLVGGTTYVQPTVAGTYNDASYQATNISIYGRYNSSTYKAYEVYVDGTLVASGDYTSTATTIYTFTKESGTNVKIEGSYSDYTYIYNITTNPEIIKTDPYQWDNGTVKTITLSITCNTYYSSDYPYTRIVIPSYSELVSKLGVDESMILSSSYSFLFSSKNLHSSSYTYTFYYRTEPTSNAGIITTLPGSSLGSIGPLSYNQSGSFTRTGSSYLGKTYYLFYHPSSWSSGQYSHVGATSSYETHGCTLTWTVSYVSISTTSTYTQNITRTNVYQMPRITMQNCIDYVKAGMGYGDFGTLTVSSFAYHTRKANASSSTLYYYQEYVNNVVVKGPYSISAGSYTTDTLTYTEDMPTVITLKRSTSSTGAYSNGSASTVLYSPTDGDNYITITYTWEP